MSRYEQSDDWAREVPVRRWRGPYRDYGWERGQSGLPEFRDPDVHLTPDEWRQVRSWEQDWWESQPSYRREYEDQWRSGPYAGIGPRGYQRSDEQIFQDVCERLSQHGYIDASDVEVKVENGEVTLSGSVEDRRTKRMAEDVADSVSGVRDVHNQLRITGNGHRQTPERWRDEVGRSGVYPASAQNAPGDAGAQGMASWGQGERGAEGYNDSGRSELHIGPVEDE